MVGKALSLFFYLKKPKNYPSGQLPVYLRVTVDGVRTELSLGRQWDAGKWNAKSNKAVGSKEDARASNEFIDTVRSKVYNARLKMLEKNEVVSAEALKKVNWR